MNSQDVFSDMRMKIVETLTEDWSPYIEKVTDAYDTAYTNVKNLLGQVQAAIVEREKSQQALMVGVLSVVTGGVVGVFADKLAKTLVPEAEALQRTTVYATRSTLMVQVSKVAQEDPILFKIFRDTTKDAINKGGEKLTEFALDQFKGEGPSDAFSPNGLSVASYRDLLSDGIASRAKLLTTWANILWQSADAFPVEVADSLRTGMLQNDFFDPAKRKHVHAKDLLVKKAELALWCAWALGRDEDYWEKQVALSNYGGSEVWDWAPLRDHLVNDLDVPEDAITVRSMMFLDPRSKVGLDMIGFMNWVKGAGMVHTMYEHIPIAGGAASHWAKKRMLEMEHLAVTAA
jgi:hypothetical protein